MKRYIKYILTFVLFSCAVSCTVDDEIANPNDGGQMVLRLASSTMTRADGDNDNSLNEDKLVIADLYLFKTDADGKATGNSQWHKRVTFNSNATDLDYKATSSNGGGSVSNLKIDNNVLTSVFGADGKSSGKLYVIANYDKVTSGEKVEVVSLPDQATLEDLQKIVVATAQWGPSTEGAAWANQSSFVMDGIGTVTKDGSSVGSSDPISLTRAAAKIELTITGYTDKVEYNGATWSPVLDNATFKAYVTMNNSVTSSYVGAAWDKTYTYDATTKRYGFTTATRKIENEDDETSKTVTVYPQANPFYSYSSDWSSTGGANKASLLLAVPWTNGTETKHSFYEIPIGSRTNDKIERNKYYKIDIFVGTLGSFEESKKVTLTPNITVVDWSTGQIDVNINQAEYLVVDETDVKIYNKTEYYIPFASSHDCIITSRNCSQSFLVTSNSNPANPTYDQAADGTTNRKYSVEIVGNNIVIKHGLNNNLHDSTNDTNGIFDFTPYTITFTISHKLENGNASTTFTQNVTITQYPAMYATADLNSDYEGDNSNNNNDNKGYVWVNGYQGTYNKNSGLSNFDNAKGCTDDDLNAVSMYTLTFTSLEGTNYVLGDPRTTEPDNLDEYNFSWASGKVLGTNQSKDGPTNYRPTDGDLTGPANNHTYNMVAPKIRVCSAYGQIATNGARQYFKNAKGRCASYQEDGYPAGRWRLPTKAEFEIINTLSRKNLIPSLFANIYYWCAHGYGQYSNGSVNLTHNDDDFGNSNSISIRCVYDEWYWGAERPLKTEAEKKTFTWGD